EAEKDTPQIRELSRTVFEVHLIPDENSLGKKLASLLTPDVVTTPAAPELGFIHRKTDEVSAYFVANTSNKALHSKASFRVKDMAPEFWDPFTGKSVPANVDGAPAVMLDLEPYESRIVVFSKERAAAPQHPEAGSKPAL